MITDDKTVLVTGGTGSFGRAFTATIVDRAVRTGNAPKKLIVYSRDEQKQHAMQMDYPETDDGFLRYIIGDIRDLERTKMAFRGVDFVVHAAAMKHVPACERDPMEALKTNVIGSENVIKAAIDAGVTRVCALSTDKACNPINFYGATKLQSEKLFQLAHNYGDTEFVITRYGNVFGSSGSVLKVFQESIKKGEPIPITNAAMTRFLISMNQAINLVKLALSMDTIKSGDIVVPKLKSCLVTDIADELAPGHPRKIIGTRQGEKLHEMLISPREDYDEYPGLYVVRKGGENSGLEYESSSWQCIDTNLAKQFVGDL